jgi:hypothetical protein
VERAEQPGILRDLLEAVAELMDADRGEWRLELLFENGKLRKAYRHEGPLRPDALSDRFGVSQA